MMGVFAFEMNRVPKISVRGRNKKARPRRWKGKAGPEVARLQAICERGVWWLLAAARRLL